MMCRHCKQKKQKKWRKGLCWKCAANKTICLLYSSQSKFARRGTHEDYFGSSPLPAEPTDAPPGSLAKMKVMQDRLSHGETLFHPQDERVIVPYLCDPFTGARLTAEEAERYLS